MYRLFQPVEAHEAKQEMADILNRVRELEGTLMDTCNELRAIAILGQQPDETTKARIDRARAMLEKEGTFQA
jgi:hypothetical protein